MCALRWWAEKIGRQGLIPADNAQLGVANRQFLANDTKARELGDKLSKVSDEYVRMRRPAGGGNHYLGTKCKTTRHPNKRRLDVRACWFYTQPAIQEYAAGSGK